MASIRDAQGQPIVAASAASAAAWDDVVHAYLGARADTRRRLDAALADDPSSVMLHVLDGYLHMLASRQRSVPLARAALARAPRTTARRETLHLAALDAWSSGDMRRAADVWDALLGEFPRDLVALKVSQFVLSYLGASKRMRDTVTSVEHAWDERMPGYGFVLGCRAYALEEAGDYAAAESSGRRAIDLNPADIWAAHAVAHVREMEGRTREGVEWVAELAPRWQGCSNFALHLRWHEALFRLELDEPERVLALYDTEVRARPSEEYLDIANAASLLWRLEQGGVDVGARWHELADAARVGADDHALVFVDVHRLMALAAVRDDAAVARFLDACERMARDERRTEAEVMARVGLALARAVVAHRAGDFGRVVSLLLPVRHRVREIGGSHAQRDLFAQLLIDAALRAARWDVAQPLLAERVAARPGNAWAWRHYARALEASGAPNAAEARLTAERLRG